MLFLLLLTIQAYVFCMSSEMSPYWISDDKTISCQLPENVVNVLNLMQDISNFSSLIDKPEGFAFNNTVQYLSNEAFLLNENIFNCMTAPFKLQREESNSFFKSQSIEVLKNSYKWCRYLGLQDDHPAMLALSYGLLKKSIAGNKTLKKHLGAFKKAIFSLYLNQEKLKEKEKNKDFIFKMWLLERFSVFSNNFEKECVNYGYKEFNIESILKWKYCINELNNYLDNDSEIPLSEHPSVQRFNNWFKEIYCIHKKIDVLSDDQGQERFLIQSVLYKTIFKEDGKADFSYSIFPEYIMDTLYIHESDRILNTLDVTFDYTYGNIPFYSIRSLFKNMQTFSCVGMNNKDFFTKYNGTDQYGHPLYTQDVAVLQYQDGHYIFDPNVLRLLLQLRIDQKCYNNLLSLPHFEDLQKKRLLKKLLGICDIIEKNRVFNVAKDWIIHHHFLMIVGIGILIPLVCGFPCAVNNCVTVFDQTFVDNALWIFDHLFYSHYVMKCVSFSLFLAELLSVSCSSKSYFYDVADFFKNIMMAACVLEYFYYFISLMYKEKIMAYDCIYMGTMPLMWGFILGQLLFENKNLHHNVLGVVWQLVRKDMCMIGHIFKAKGLPEIVVV